MGLRQSKVRRDGRSRSVAVTCLILNALLISARICKFELNLDIIHGLLRAARMKFSSLANPQIRSLEELIVFCYEDKRVLLPLPPSYVVSCIYASGTNSIVEMLNMPTARRTRSTRGL